MATSADNAGAGPLSWGCCEVLAVDAAFTLKRLVVQPGCGTSPRHRPFREHWYVVEGQANADVEGTQLLLGAGQAVDIPPHCWHSVANGGSKALTLIVVQAAERH